MEPITFYNRYTDSTETEQVYGESFLKWAYGNPLGKIALHAFVKRPFFSAWYGRRMDHPKTKEKVAPFIDDYQMNVDDFLDTPESYPHFNAFFYRKLKPSARPIADTDLVFPADGRHLGFENAEDIAGAFIKGQKWDLRALIDDDALYQQFKGGSLVLSRLCPVDYHRFHFPCVGTPGETRVINGPLFSVSPIALRQNLSYMWENKRTCTVLDTPDLGKVLILEIGATCVGSILQTYQANQAIAKGDEKGYFAFGGSSTITIFQPAKVQLSSDLLEHSANCQELYARMGDTMGDTMGEKK
ncbi:phosphatidylserine decarboxylase [Rubritalea profundi]|uniref:Phosphatidylserine decarboxylase n=1 Tax=Rubritalea profundi TaxID=1658618 RepID=A0A2S7U4E5_9BACT|nr:phosphatidylserine decarboxylase [Rubritalea profundi]PQJ29888.1 phosphatidylserine decarboxylase [Rubritalea profundi]